MIELRDVLIPAVDLGEMFGSASPAGERWGVIVEIGGIGRVALMFDIVHDQEEIVIKPVSPLIRAAGIYSGATVLGRDRKSTRRNPSHSFASRMPSSACNK